MRWSNPLILASALLAAFSGCRNCDLVEAELRTRNEDLRNARAELAKAEFINDSLAREVTALRQQGPGKLTPEQAAQTTTLKEIVLSRQTGGYDQDHQPGDEALMVAFEPRDGDGHVIKAPGSLQVTAQEVSKEGLKTMLSVWDVSPEEMRRSWHEGFFSKGYQVILPWKTWPNSDHLRVTVRFYLADGRVFEADKDVTVRLAPQALRKCAPGPLLLDLPGQAALKPAEPLPMPRTSQSNKPKADEAAWWARPATPAPIPPEEFHWRPKAPPSLADSVEMGKPQPIRSSFGQYQQ
ncbi:MAG TPA: hypothetical protein VGP68_16270 [Gemmataceae bacterium]|jgi:hypothetical protein|nr:hypothetical protein [Gemmataceae bacterium]